MSRRSRWLTGAILRPAEAGANVIVTMTVGSGTALSGVVPPTLALNKSLGHSHRHRGVGLLAVGELHRRGRSGGCE